METHKYHGKELRTQAKIKKAGLEITLVQKGRRTGGPDYAPTFSESIETRLFALTTSNEQIFRNRQSSLIKKVDLVLMVSTENIDGNNPPAVADTVKIVRSAAFPNITTGDYQILEIETLSPGGVPIFYILGIVW